MNILIVGNGFDLSHYLPTKYDHFMDVMKVIETKDISINIDQMKDLDEMLRIVESTLKKREQFGDPDAPVISFDDLFSHTRDEKFIEKTKKYYLVENINLNLKETLELKFRIKENSWYQYFKNHVEEIKTWIDFEQKIEEVLLVLAQSLVRLEKFEIEQKMAYELDLSEILNKKSLQILNYFNFYYESGGSLRIAGKNKSIPYSLNVNPKYCFGNRIENGFNPTAFLDHLHNQLEAFIKIFNIYLGLIINQLVPIGKLSLEEVEWIHPNKIYSFNYTNTYQKNYNSFIDIDYLHGSFGVKQNIVLGVSELQDDALKKIKAYGFTKYHQKLFKETDYLFLDENSKVKQAIEVAQSYLTKDNINFYFWGHSLDVSDREYIEEIFSFNSARDNRVRVTVYYFDNMAKFSLLNNLLTIIGKDKVEKWMKKKWLQFKENPEIKFDEMISEKTA